MRITGSVLKYFSCVTLGTADEKQYTLRMDAIKKAAIALIGVPHLGFRARASLIACFLAGVPRDARILDAGSGYGIYALTLADYGYTVDAVELVPERVKALNDMAREVSRFNKAIRCREGSLTALPMTDSSYDVIICSDVIEHIADDSKAVSELARVLASGGLLIITVPYHSRHNASIYRRFGHERPGYTGAQMQKLIEPFGLTIEATECYEFRLGTALFEFHNRFHAPVLLAGIFALLYPWYCLDRSIALGEPNGIGFKMRKKR